jgi:hypothetical protein
MASGLDRLGGSENVCNAILNRGQKMKRSAILPHINPSRLAKHKQS